MRDHLSMAILGPLGYLAAHQYYNLYGSLSTHWDWAASTLDLTTPPPLSLSRLHENPTAPPTPQTTLHATSLTTPSEAKPPDTLGPTTPLPEPNPSSAPRDLSRFMVDDNSPLSQRNVSRLEPRCSDGRNLSAIKRTNYVRGGHRLDPDTPSSKGGLRAKSKQELAFLFGSGKSALMPDPPLHENSQSGEQGTLEYGKFKADMYASYCKGKGKSDKNTYGKSK